MIGLVLRVAIFTRTESLGVRLPTCPPSLNTLAVNVDRKNVAPLTHRIECHASNVEEQVRFLYGVLTTHSDQTPRWKGHLSVKQAAFGPSGFDSHLIHLPDTGCKTRGVAASHKHGGAWPSRKRNEYAKWLQIESAKGYLLLFPIGHKHRGFTRKRCPCNRVAGAVPVVA